MQQDFNVTRCLEKSSLYYKFLVKKFKNTLIVRSIL